ncbi:Aromatic amino acid exporter YddG [Kluyvera cryocrescens]|uniref:Aromatic amino acid exporter YddG n=1 Tax=Kluyvera cryocrescens TaxID=580 RepID=A0A485CT98_KLUCR|nr:Aromatic amino acid exporter YddG [Kluyvera cryocrescens]
MIYSLSGLLLIFTVGFPQLRQIPPRYLLVGSLFFVSYEMCLALSLGYAGTRQQAIEVGMVNYLWPSLTILFAIIFNGQKTTWLVIPGLLLSIVGVTWVLGGEHGLDLAEIRSNVISSPLSYILAFVGPLSGQPTARSPRSMPKAKMVSPCLFYSPHSPSG